MLKQISKQTLKNRTILHKLLVMNFFPYSWHIVDQEIQVYGFLENQETCLLRIEDFTPYIYIKLPLHVEWTFEKIRMLVGFLQRKNPRTIHKSGKYDKRPLYYSNVEFVDEKTFEYNTHPYLFLSFHSDRDRKKFCKNMNEKSHNVGFTTMKFEIYEHNASPILQFSCIRDISTCDWFYVKNLRNTTGSGNSYRYDNEYTVHWKSIYPINKTTELGVPQPLIMSWDIECCFNDVNKFSDGSNDKDVVFQISCVFGKQGTPKHTWEKYLLTLGNPDLSLLKGITVQSFKSELQLIRGFCDIITKKNPQVLIGYNIFKFDIPFMYKRACNKGIEDEFVRHGCTFKKCEFKKIAWSSSAYSNQEMNFIDLDGRITIDLLTLIQRDYNLESYKLDSVSEKFVDGKKDPLNHLDIFMCYKKGIKESENGISKSLSIVGKYCVKDSVLVLELFEKLQYWYTLVEMAKICQVPLSHLFLYGQQLKVFSQVYKYCYNNNIVVESGCFKTSEDDFCSGAYVFTPEPGLYDNVVSFDFQSLYPSIIVSHNIDFTTLVIDPKIPDKLCHVIEWEEHINCGCEGYTISKDVKTIRCHSYKFRWLKDPPGVLPIIIQNLLNARKNVRKQMKNITDKNSSLYNVLNKRQLAYKVSSNSMYGALSTKRGYLPFLPGGMCITAIGRESVEKVSKIIENEYQGKIIYGDTDSNYVSFPHLNNLQDIWDYSVKVSDEVSKYFPEPMRLEFEDNIYHRYLILSKKRYLYFSTDTDGNVSNKLENKGVLLKRRDNCKLIRDIYETIIRMIMNRKNEYTILEKLLEFITILYTVQVPIEDYQISKSVKEIQNFTTSLLTQNEKKIRYGDYLVPKIKEEEKERRLQFLKKGIKNLEDYEYARKFLQEEQNKNTVERDFLLITRTKQELERYETTFYQSSLPGAVQLAIRMRERGQHIESGSRLSFVLTKKASIKSCISDKMEEVEYFKTNYKKSMIDSTHYLRLLINSIEEVLKITQSNGIKRYTNFIKDIYENHIKYDTVVNELFGLCNGIVWDEEFIKKTKKVEKSKKVNNNMKITDLWTMAPNNS